MEFRKYCGTALVIILTTVGASAERQPQLELTAIQEAYKAAKENLVSGSGTGTYEIYFARAEKGAKLELKAKAKAKVFFDRGKFHIRLDYEKDDIHRLDSRVIIYDGTAILASRMSKRIHPSNSEGDIYEAKPTLSVMRQAGFDYNPSELPANVLPVANLQGFASALTITPDANMDYFGTYDIPPVVHCTFLASRAAGYHVTNYREYNTNHDNFQHVNLLAAWEQKNGLWYVKSIDRTWLSVDGSGERMVFKYAVFEPNVDVPASLFKFDALSLSPTARVIDRRPNTEEPVLRQPQTSKVDAAKLDTLAEAVKSLTPSSTPLTQRSKLPHYLLLAIGLLFSLLGLLFIWKRRARKGKSTPET